MHVFIAFPLTEETVVISIYDISEAQPCPSIYTNLSWRFRKPSELSGAYLLPVFTPDSLTASVSFDRFMHQDVQSF